MADTGDTIHAVAGYLGVKCGKITYEGEEKGIVQETERNIFPQHCLELIPVTKGKTGTRKGFCTITKHLTRSSEKAHLLGVSLEDKAVVDQWLELTICQIDRTKDIKTTLKDLNTYLTDKVYFLNHRLTLIDLVLYYSLHSYVCGLTYYEKQKLTHLSRWFSNMQSTATVRQSFPSLGFSRTTLYSGSAH